MTSSVALEGGIKRVSVNLHNTGFGIKRGGFPSPRLWFAHSNSSARYDPEAGFLEVVERPGMVPGGWEIPPSLWLDLPEAYRTQQIDDISVRARGYVELNGLSVRDAYVETHGSVMVMGVHLGHACLVKSVKGDVFVSGLHAPETADPQRWPSAEVAALTGMVSIAESTGSWRLTGHEILADGARGPQHATLLTPIGQPQPVHG